MEHEDFAPDAPPFLLVGVSEYLAGAFESSLAVFGKTCERAPVDLRDELWGRELATRLMRVDYSVPLVIGHPEVWAAMKVADEWSAPRGWARSAIPVGSVNPSPLVTYVGSSRPRALMDALRARDADGFSLGAFLGAGRAPNRAIGCVLAAAALRSLALSRHRMATLARPLEHADLDEIAAVRLLQGAHLAGFLDSITARSAVEQILGHPLRGDTAYERQLRALFQFPWPAENCPRRRTHRNGEVFGDILLIDNSGAWEAAIEAVWLPLGLSVNPPESAAQVTPTESARALCALVDIAYPSEPYHGAGTIRVLSTAHPELPLIVSSVYDDHSSADHLRRSSAFLWLSKGPRVERPGERDEVSYFRRHMDAVLLAGLGSLSREMTQLWRRWFVDEANGELEVTDATHRGRMLTFVTEAMGSVPDYCRRMFEESWYGVPGTKSLVAREMVRGLGLINDGWCDLAANGLGHSKNFDPDAFDESPPPRHEWRDVITDWLSRVRAGRSRSRAAGQDSDVSKARRRQGWEAIRADIWWPNAAYHHAATLLRDQASHARVSGLHFTDADVWIMALLLLLKAHGLREITGSGIDDRDFDEYVLLRLTQRLWELQWLAGYLDKPFPEDLHGDLPTLRDGVRETAARLGQMLMAWREERKGERSIITGAYGERDIDVSTDSPMVERVAFLPYALRLHPRLPLLFEVSEEALRTQTSSGRLLADLLLLEMIHRRAARAATSDAGGNPFLESRRSM